MLARVKINKHRSPFKDPSIDPHRTTPCRWEQPFRFVAQVLYTRIIALSRNFLNFLFNKFIRRNTAL